MQDFVRLTILVSFWVWAIFCPCGCQTTGSDEQSPVVAMIAKLIPDSQQQRKKLQQQLLSPDADLRRDGVYMLAKGDATDWPVTPKILSTMAKGDPDAQVRAVAVSVLAKIDDDSYLQEVLPIATKDSSSLVRMECVNILAGQTNDQGLEILLKMLRDDDDSNIRTHAAQALKNYRQQKALRALLAGLADEQFSVSYQSRDSLREITGKDFGYNQASWQNWLNTEYIPNGYDNFWQGGASTHLLLAGANPNSL